MKCYKCGTTENLSKRARNTYMCRGCRRDEYHKKKNTWHREDPDELRRIRWAITWDMIAKEINERIMLKYKYEKR